MVFISGLQAGKRLPEILGNFMKWFNSDRESHGVFQNTKRCAPFRGQIEHCGQIGNADQRLG
jgi:hypothetical protein